MLCNKFLSPSHQLRRPEMRFHTAVAPCINAVFNHHLLQTVFCQSLFNKKGIPTAFTAADQRVLYGLSLQNAFKEAPP